MSRDLPGEIATTLAPVDRTARQVTSRGEHWEVRLSPNEVLSDVPLPTREVHSDSVDLSGRVFGRLTVIGLAEKRGAWVVRCSCGRYCHRKALFLRKNDGRQKMCAHCDKLEEFRKHSGNWPNRMVP